MSKADQFRQYAEEAMRWAYQSKTEKNKQVLIELARTWTQAAVQSDSTVVVNDNAPEHKAASIDHRQCAAEERNIMDRHNRAVPK